MNRKNILILTALIAALLLIVAVIVLVGNSQKSPAPSGTVPTGSTTAEPTVRPETQAPTTRPVPVPSTAAPTTQPPETTEAPTSAPEPQETEGIAETQAPPSPPPTEAPTEPPETEPQPISLPYAIPETDLVIRSVNSYDGIFLEDGSDTPIVGVAAIILENNGDQCVDYAKIDLVGTSTSYSFVASGLEAHSVMVVMEENKAPCISQDYWSAAADVALTDSFEMSPDSLLVEETEDGQLKVTNLTEADIPCVRVFYKFHMAEEDVYVGGITYTAKILDLKAGASATVAPSHYAAGSSRVIMAKIYDTDAN